MNYWKKGFLFGVALIAVWILYFVVVSFFGYEGKCGGFMSFLAGERDCSYFDYLKQNFTLLVLLFPFAYWKWIIGILISSTLLGGIIKQFKK